MIVASRHNSLPHRARRKKCRRNKWVPDEHYCSKLVNILEQRPLATDASGKYELLRDAFSDATSYSVFHNLLWRRQPLWNPPRGRYNSRFDYAAQDYPCIRPATSPEKRKTHRFEQGNPSGDQKKAKRNQNPEAMDGIA